MRYYHNGGWHTWELNHGAWVITWVNDPQWWIPIFTRDQYKWMIAFGPFGVCYWYIYKP